LRAGIAKLVTLNERLWYLKNESREYQRARILADERIFLNDWKSILEDCRTNEFLTERFVNHFFASCMLLASTGKMEKASILAHSYGQLSESTGDSNMDEVFSPKDTKKQSIQWAVLSAVKAEFGQTLGGSLKRGFEGVRTWVSSYAIWGDVFVLESPQSDFSIQQLQQLVNDSEPRTGREAAVQFLVRGLELLRSKRPHFSSKSTINFGSIGILLPISCGHNGFLSEVELASYSAWLNGLNLWGPSNQV
jgi:hypothetical protein